MKARSDFNGEPRQPAWAIAPAAPLIIVSQLVLGTWFCPPMTPAQAQEQPPASLQLPGATSSGPGFTLEFNLNIPDNRYFIYLAVAFVFAVIGAALHYRAVLESQIRQGIHPYLFGWTVYIFWFGVFLLACFLILWNADLGIHLGLLVLFILACLAAQVSGRLILRYALIVLVLLVAVGAFRYWPLIA